MNAPGRWLGGGLLLALLCFFAFWTWPELTNKRSSFSNNGIAEKGCSLPAVSAVVSCSPFPAGDAYYPCDRPSKAAGQPLVSLDVQIAGGQQLEEGNVRLTVEGESEPVFFVYRGTPVTLDAFPKGRGATVIIGHNLVEYERYPTFSFPAHQIDGAATLSCLIPVASEPQSALTIDLSSFGPDQHLHVSVEVAGMGLFSKTCAGREIYKTPITRADLVVQVKVTGDAQWRSGDIRLIPGQRVHVRPFPEVPASVRIKITNNLGELIPSAIVTCETSVMMRHKQLLTLPPGTSLLGDFSLSDTDGLALLGGLRSGDYGLLIYAEGFEPKSVFGLFVSGEETDLGTVILDKKR